MLYMKDTICVMEKSHDKMFEYRDYGVGGVKVLITNNASGDDFNKYLNIHPFMSVCTLDFFLEQTWILKSF